MQARDGRTAQEVEVAQASPAAQVPNRDAVDPEGETRTAVASGSVQPRQQAPHAAVGPKRLWNWTKWSAVRDAALAQLEAVDLVPHQGTQPSQPAASVREPLLVAPTMLGANAAPIARTRQTGTESAFAGGTEQAPTEMAGRLGQASPSGAAGATLTDQQGPSVAVVDSPEASPLSQGEDAAVQATQPAVPSTPNGTAARDQDSPETSGRPEARPVDKARRRAEKAQAVHPAAAGNAEVLGTDPATRAQAGVRGTAPVAPETLEAGSRELDAPATSEESPVAAPSAARNGAETGPSAATIPAPSVARTADRNPAAQAEGTPAVDGRTLRQLSDRILLLATSRRKDAVVVRLEPRDLGVLTITINQAQNQVEATVAASNDQVRAALQQSAPALQQSLETKGLQLASLNIEAQTGGFGGFGDRAGQPNAGPQQQPLPFRLNQGSPAVAQREAPHSDAPSAEKAVDYRI